MKNYINDEEYIDLVRDILDNEEFKKLNKYKHHSINRKEHCIGVSYRSYIIAKKLKLKYREVARAGLLHDFFLINNQKLKLLPRIKVIFSHPMTSLENSKKYFKLSEVEENIIKSHMFPIGLVIPKYKESFLVDLVDDYLSIYERISNMTNKISIVFEKKM